MHLLKKTAALLLLITGCRSSAPPPDRTGTDTFPYPYSPVYSNSFRPASGQRAQQVLAFWKEYETGDVLHTAALFADSIRFILPDTILQGSARDVLSAFRRKRSVYSDMQCYVDSWMPLEETMRQEQLVLLWGRQDGTTQQGKRVYRVLHEVWRFDREGKIRQLEQYETHPH